MLPGAVVAKAQAPTRPWFLLLPCLALLSPSSTNARRAGTRGQPILKFMARRGGARAPAATGVKLTSNVASNILWLGTERDGLPPAVRPPMTPTPTHTQTDVTQLLREWSGGSGEALDRVIPVI